MQEQKKMKYRSIKITFILSLLFLIHCGVKQPVRSLSDSPVGDIYVSSGGLSGTIFIDGENTNKITPDTLFSIPVGSHLIQLYKEGYQSVPESILVLVEENKLSHAKFEFEKLIQISYVGIITLPESGKIFVDDQFTGKITPDTIQVEEGPHQMKIKKNGYKDLTWEIIAMEDSLVELHGIHEINQCILLESFANVSCIPCVEVTNNLNDFVINQDADQYAIIEYFTNWPNPNDPFYKEAPQDVNKRVTYYGTTALPELRIAGSKIVDPSNYLHIVSKFQSALSGQNTPIGISIEKEYLNGILQVYIEMYNFENSFTDENLRLYVAVIENKIHFDSPPGSNGLSDFHFVFRSFLSSNEGDLIQSNSHCITHNYSFDWPDWNYSNSQVIAFIQDMSSKRIIQTSIK
jgi:hypothetical protein